MLTKKVNKNEVFPVIYEYYHLPTSKSATRTYFVGSTCFVSDFLKELNRLISFYNNCYFGNLNKLFFLKSENKF